MSVDTDLSQNWTGVTITPNGGSAINFDNVTNISVKKGNTQTKFYANGKKFPTHIKNTMFTRTLTISSAGIKKLQAIGDTPCTITGTLNDASNGAGTGALTVQLVNAVVQEISFDNPNNQYGSGTATFEAYSTDGVTDPYTATPVA